MGDCDIDCGDCNCDCFEDCCKDCDCDCDCCDSDCKCCECCDLESCLHGCTNCMQQVFCCLLCTDSDADLGTTCCDHACLYVCCDDTHSSSRRNRDRHRAGVNARPNWVQKQYIRSRMTHQHGGMDAILDQPSSRHPDIGPAAGTDPSAPPAYDPVLAAELGGDMNSSPPVQTHQPGSVPYMVANGSSYQTLDTSNRGEGAGDGSGGGATIGGAAVDTNNVPIQVNQDSDAPPPSYEDAVGKSSTV